LSIPRIDSIGPEVVALGGVVVDDVEDHLDAGRVQRLTIVLNSGNQAVFGHEVVYRHQLDC
jgi:hypothetical protein